jgi:hypothetical protein
MAFKIIMGNLYGLFIGKTDSLLEDKNLGCKIILTLTLKT